ncbi:bifunctional 3-deoxy-7-phosphoheptulonate synthase/chorismate mutase [Virgibacillus salexigens]
MSMFKAERIDDALIELLCVKGQMVEESLQKIEISYDDIASKNKGPYQTETIIEILQMLACKTSKKEQDSKVYLHSRDHQLENSIVKVGDTLIGDQQPHFIIGPCSVESYEQVYHVAEQMSERGMTLLRGGAFKPRTSPYDFQGLGLNGLQILSEVAKQFNMSVITEIMSTESIDEAYDYVDVVQIGSRNMHNFDLLRAVGKLDKPVLLKRGLSATIHEFKMAAEYILNEGNNNVILCERGIRTYETATRNTLDISAVPILKQETHLPVFADVSHSAGRKDLLIPQAKAAIAAGADGVMAEVHPNPQVALSDAKQQMDLLEFHSFMDQLDNFLHRFSLSASV